MAYLRGCHLRAVSVPNWRLKRRELAWESYFAASPRASARRTSVSGVASGSKKWIGNFAARARLGEVRPQSCFDQRRFRRNVIVKTEGPGFVENGWIAHELIMASSLASLWRKKGDRASRDPNRWAEEDRKSVV